MKCISNHNRPHNSPILSPSSREEFLTAVRTLMSEYLTQSDKIAIITDGSLASAVVIVAMSELFGKEHVTAVICPHLSLNNPDGVFTVCQRFCGEVKTIPVTMAVADIMNELTHAGIGVHSKEIIERFVDMTRWMIADALRDDGYVIAPDFLWEATENEILAIAGKLGLPLEYFKTSLCRS